jgi:hypothetical protein
MNTDLKIKVLSLALFIMPFVFSAPALAEVKSQTPPSTTAQRLYRSAQNDLLQLRILTKNGRVQAVIGSGFVIGTSSLVVTNYHVVSKLALKPKIYLGEYLDANGNSGAIELLAVDVLHDLAVVRAANRKGTGFFTISDHLAQLKQGQYLYSLGNPLDLGFTISEGSYNGIMRGGFYDQFLFTGPINSGMSGGPCITADGHLAGVNVSVRTDGQLVSFIVPAKYVQTLLKKTSAMKELTKNFKVVIGQQLLEHQATIVDRVLAGPLDIKKLGKYRVPVRESDQIRCWGESSDQTKQLYTSEHIQCGVENEIFVDDNLYVGDIAIRHIFTQSTKLGPWRFSQLVASSIREEKFGNHKDKHQTAPHCTEEYISNGKLPMRAVLCVRGYKKFAGLYDFSVLTDTLDESQMNLESRLDAKGVSYENGLRISRTFLDGINREKKP